jgi:hypothetical protein
MTEVLALLPWKTLTEIKLAFRYRVSPACSRPALQRKKYNEAAYLLSNTIGRATDSSGNVRAVAESVDMISTSGVVAEAGTSAELLVSNVDSRVNNIGECSATSRSVIDVAS